MNTLWLNENSYELLAAECEEYATYNIQFRGILFSEFRVNMIKVLTTKADFPLSFFPPFPAFGLVHVNIWSLCVRVVRCIYCLNLLLFW